MSNKKLYIEILHIGFGCEGWIPTYDSLKEVVEKLGGSLPKRDKKQTDGILEGHLKNITINVELKMLTQGDSVPEKYRGSPTLLYRIGQTDDWTDLIEEGGLPMNTHISCRPYRHPNHNDGKPVTYVPIELIEERFQKVLTKYER
jgi:hypothetical protein